MEEWIEEGMEERVKEGVEKGGEYRSSGIFFIHLRLYICDYVN